MPRQSIAVIGSGISGLSASWLLAERHDVTLFEAGPYAGGHSNTVDVALPDGEVAVDTGFIVYNAATYPNLIALFDRLGVATAPTEMSFAVSLDQGAYEYSGSGAAGMFGQPANLLSPRHWAMVYDIARFFSAAGRLDPVSAGEISLGTYLANEGYGRSFVERHILPMAAAIWSAPRATMLDFPLASFVRFFANHGLLQMRQRPNWRTVVGGSRNYVRRLLAAPGLSLRLNEGVRAVERGASGVQVSTHTGSHAFDQVVFACHADQALALVTHPTAEEKRLLGVFTYSRNSAVLHRDARLMPRRRRLWSSWNYIGESDEHGDRLCTTYWMNRLQPLKTQTDLFVTLNPTVPPEPEGVLGEFAYTHPVFDRAAMAAQQELWSLQGQQRSWFCGSYFGYGFHEDGLQSGLAVAEQLGGVRRPWAVADENGRILGFRAPVSAAAMSEAA